MVRFASVAPSWRVNSSRVLSQDEIDTVIADLTPHRLLIRNLSSN